jgi:hypothetical protein
MINGLQGEVPSHELDNGFEPIGGSAHPNACETNLSDGRIDNSIGSILVEQPFGYFVGSIVLSNFFTHEEYIGVCL